MLKTPASSVSATLALALGLMGQTPALADSFSDADHAIEGLRQVSRELTESLKSFYTHLDETMARQDRGYRSGNGRLVPSADVDLNSGPADLMWVAARRFATFRMLASRNEHYEPAPVVDLDHIQQLLVETRKRVDASTKILRRLLVVSVVDFDPRKDALTKSRRDQLHKARSGAEWAAKLALLALPIDQPESGSQDETAQKAWDHLGRGLPAGNQKPEWIPPRVPIDSSQGDARQGDFPQSPTAIPIRLDHRKRVLLINEPSYRMAMTDSGIEDDQGRHIFYQEEWAQRGPSVLRFRWRVAVETATGEHVLLKRYPPLELHGSMEDLYQHRDRDYLWYLEPDDDSTEPTRDEVESALAEVARSREAIRAAAQDFNTKIREALARQDRLHTAMNEPVVDSGLPDGMRQTLFAIRAHLARVAAIFNSEANVRLSVVKAEMAVRDLEPLAAWSNGPSKMPDWAQLLERSDREIDSVRIAENETLISLPPDSSRDEDSFPALDRNVIIRIRRAPSRARDTAVRCLQEVWRMESGMTGTREVRRSVSLILIDPRTGTQTRAGGATKFYKAPPGDLLEEIYDEYAADDISLGRLEFQAFKIPRDFPPKPFNIGKFHLEER